MILLHSDESTVASFLFSQFGDAVEEKEHSSQIGSRIMLPEFENEEVIAEVAAEFQTEEVDQDCSPRPVDHSQMLVELEKKQGEIQAMEKKILAQAQKSADDILKQAYQEAEGIKIKAFEEASKEGYQDGYEKAYEEHKAVMSEETAMFLLQMRDAVDAYGQEKELLITQNIEELKELSIAIAEKIIHVSLKTSGEIIKKMIVTATNKMKHKEWVKIYIAKSDSSLIVEANADLLDALSHVSEHIKVVVMEDSLPGTCIIELPDQIIDASAATQIENIKGIMKSVGTRRE
ncbi:MAG: FliH/SctL family protein [Anaerotignum sp.]